MATKRQRALAAQRSADFAKGNAEGRREIIDRLRAAKTVAEAHAIVDSAPPPDTPRRAPFSNLGFFLGEFRMPHGATSWEIEAYVDFVRRLDATGQLKPGGLARIEAAAAASLAALAR